jgi:uncharacterized protein (TIGR03067 family)
MAASSPPSYAAALVDRMEAAALRLMGILLALGLAALAFAGDAAELAGSWTALRAERDGVSAPELIGHRLVFTGDRFAIAGPDGQPLYAGTYSVDDLTQPGSIDFVHDGGTAAGQTWEGLYRLDGGELTIVDDAPDPAQGRPTDFTTAKGSGRVPLVFAR